MHIHADDTEDYCEKCCGLGYNGANLCKYCNGIGYTIIGTVCKYRHNKNHVYHCRYAEFVGLHNQDIVYYFDSTGNIQCDDNSKIAKIDQIMNIICWTEVPMITVYPCLTIVICGFTFIKMDTWLLVLGRNFHKINDEICKKLDAKLIFCADVALPQLSTDIITNKIMPQLMPYGDEYDDILSSIYIKTWMLVSKHYYAATVAHMNNASTMVRQFSNALVFDTDQIYSYVITAGQMFNNIPCGLKVRLKISPYKLKIEIFNKIFGHKTLISALTFDGASKLAISENGRRQIYYNVDILITYCEKYNIDSRAPGYREIELAKILFGAKVTQTRCGDSDCNIGGIINAVIQKINKHACKK